MSEDAPQEQTQPPAPGRHAPRVKARRSSLFSRGESMIWMSGGALAVSLLMIVGLLVLVAWRGGEAFWPKRLERIESVNGGVVLGERTETEPYEPEAHVFDALPEDERAAAIAEVGAKGGKASRLLLRTGNKTPENRTDFLWIPDFAVKSVTTPEWAVTMERAEWGPFYGQPAAFLEGDTKSAESPEEAWKKFEAHHEDARDKWLEAGDLAEDDLGEIDKAIDEARLATRSAARVYGAGSKAHEDAQAREAKVVAALDPARQKLVARIAKLRAESSTYRLLMTKADGTQEEVRLVDIVRAYPANQLGWGGRFGVYMSRWWEYLTDDPREANAEGGVWPAIFGTVVMTMLMTLLVVPFGVLGALYLREYARQGRLVSVVRIAVNNLASVPSIVFGVFGLGFFCYFVGAGVDELFFADRLPNPTYGKSGLLWASLTLALLTLPVVVVATEEALTAVPDSMREGSYACGASKWQTIRRIVLPRAMPGIMTGMILAIARGAGEVAPLMLVGAVKMAPELPIDGTAPFIHPERSFMHLGFHIYDLGFQTQNAKAAEPLVFTTTLLLIGIVVVLNVAAIRIRGRLRAAHAES